MVITMKKVMPILLLSVLSSFIICKDSNNQKIEQQDLPAQHEKYEQLRYNMVENQIVSRGVTDNLVLKAMRSVPRHKFVPVSLQGYAYEDYPLPIGEEQTISQPYIVALMTELLMLKGNEKVMEIGTGSGYQAAVLAEIVDSVYTIEIIPSLAEQSKVRLQKMGYKNIHVRCGDGYKGWKEKSPFDGIIVTAAPRHVPQPLLEQLKSGGRLVIPVGEFYQELLLITKTRTGEIKQQSIIPVRFVPMTGEAEDKK